MSHPYFKNETQPGPNHLEIVDLTGWRAFVDSVKDSTGGRVDQTCRVSLVDRPALHFTVHAVFGVTAQS